MSGRLCVAIVVGIIAVTGFLATSCQKEGEQSEPIRERAVSLGSTQPATASLEKPAKGQTRPRARGEGMAAIESATQAGKYLFVFFYRDGEDEQTRKMRKVFDGAMKKVADRAECIAIDLSDPSEEEIVDKLNVSRAPMPLALALAPNGAITGGFPTEFDGERIVEAFASPSMEKCLKALQDRKLVLLCVQNGSTRLNDGAMQGVRDFKADPRYGRWTEIVALDPADPAEARALENLKVDPETKEAVTVLLAPPGAALAKFKGETNKNMLVATLNRANSGCGPGGCGPGGCGPRRK